MFFDAIIIALPYLNEDVGAENNLKGVVPKEKSCAVDCLSILHEVRTPNFDQVDVEDADDHGRQGVRHRGVAVNPIMLYNVQYQRL